MRIGKLDGLRGAASLMVVLHHYGKEMLPTALYGSPVVRSSHIFVDFFFVLSGYVIALNYADRITDGRGFRVFLRKRVTRLYPLLAYTTLVFLAFEAASALLLPDTIRTPASASELALQTLDTLLLTNATPLLGSSDGMNFPSWSISAEMISYVVFGLILRTCSGWTRLAAIAVVMGAAAAMLLSHGRYFTGGEFGFARALLCFHAGTLVHLLPATRKPLPAAMDLAVPAGILTALFALHAAPEPGRSLIGIALLPPFFAACILILMATEGVTGRFLGSGMMRFAGRISYSVYLNHAIVVLVLPRLVFHHAGIPKGTLTETLTCVGTIMALLAYSSLTYRLVELGGGRWMGRLLSGKGGRESVGGDRGLQPFPEGRQRSRVPSPDSE